MLGAARMAAAITFHPRPHAKHRHSFGQRQILINSCCGLRSSFEADMVCHAVQLNMKVGG